MSKNPSKRKCSAVRNDGQPCQAWAVIGSDPALCPAHAGLQKGAGAPIGNKNAVTHGLYMSIMKPEEIANVDVIESRTLLHELVLTRVGLMRLANHMNNNDPPLSDLLTILPVMSTMVRTVAFLLGHIDDNIFDWDEVLDDLGKEWGMDL